MAFATAQFEAVRSALARNLGGGEELGTSLVLDINGDIVIDMWGSFPRPGSSGPVVAGHRHQRLVLD